MSVDAKAFRASLAVLNGAIHNNAAQAMRMAVEVAEKSAKDTTLYNDRSGYTRAHTKGFSFGLDGKLVADSDAATYLENGTRPHVIEAKGSALSFVVAGQQRFARRVNHPGTAARPFMQVARDAGEQALDYGLEFMTTAAIERS